MVAIKANKSNEPQTIAQKNEIKEMKKHIAKNQKSALVPSAKDAKRTWPKFLRTLKSEARELIADFDARTTRLSSMRASLKYGGNLTAKQKLAYIYAKLALLSSKSNRDQVVSEYLKSMQLAPLDGSPLHAAVGHYLQLNRTEGRRIRSEYVRALRYLISRGIGPAQAASFQGSIRSWGAKWGAVANPPQQNSAPKAVTIATKLTSLNRSFTHGRTKAVIRLR